MNTVFFLISTLPLISALLFFDCLLQKLKKKVQVTGFLNKAVYTTTSVAGSWAGAEKS